MTCLPRCMPRHPTRSAARSAAHAVASSAALSAALCRLPCTGAELHGKDRRSCATDRRALHLGRLQFLPTGRQVAVSAEVGALGRCPRLPRRLLAPPRRERPLRRRRLKATQAAQQRSNGARFSYTPQVIVNGVDRPDWPRAVIASPAAQATAAEARMTRAGKAFTATISSVVTMRLAVYWAVTEPGHLSAVKAGEDQGATLTHDRVVREYRPVAAWAPNPGARRPRCTFSLRAHPSRGDPAKSISCSSMRRTGDRSRR